MDTDTIKASKNFNFIVCQLFWLSKTVANKINSVVRSLCVHAYQNIMTKHDPVHRSVNTKKFVFIIIIIIFFFIFIFYFLVSCVSVATGLKMCGFCGVV